MQPGTVRAAGNGLGVLTANAAHTAIRPAGTLDAAGFGLTVHDLHGGGHITNSGAAATLSVDGGNFSGVIGGAFNLFVQSPLLLSGDNTYTGGHTTIAILGTLTLGDGGTTGSVPGPITDSGTLQFRHSGTFVEAGVISANGNVVQSGPGTTVLTATNTYSGGTYLSGGTLEAQTPGAIGSGAVTFLAGAPETLRIDGMVMPGNAILNFSAANIAADSWAYGGFALTLLHGGFIVAQLNLSTPFGAHPLFALSGDGVGGTNIVLEPPPPQDLNADNLPDLMFQTPNNAFLGAVSTGGGFTTPQLWVQHGGTFLAGEAQYADVNNDRRADLIFQGSDNRFYVSLSTGNAFTAPVQWVQHGGSFTPGQAQYADVNADGRADLIMQSGDNGFYVSLSTGGGFTPPALWVQHGGSFTAGQAQYADVGGSFTPGQAQYADVNGDGRFDLLFQASDNKEYLSLSSGLNFGAPTLVADFGAYGPFQPGTLHV